MLSGSTVLGKSEQAYNNSISCVDEGAMQQSRQREMSDDRGKMGVKAILRLWLETKWRMLCVVLLLVKVQYTTLPGFRSSALQCHLSFPSLFLSPRFSSSSN